MKLYNGELTVRNEQAGSTVAIQSGTTLSKVVEQTDLYEVPYMLVLDDTDRLLGIASSIEVLDRTLRRNLRERERWLGMPVDSVMLPMHDLCTQRTSSDSFFALRSRTTIQCIPIVDNDRVVAVVNGNDLLVSYQGVESLLLRAMTDPVTGLPTRSVFLRRLDDEWKRAIATGESVSVILIDVDHFKEVNDRCGHHVGDAVLHMVGSCLRRSLRSYDVVARYGGDEFAAICFGCRPGEIDIPLKRLQDEIGRLSIPADIGIHGITLSLGAVSIHDAHPEWQPNELIEAADKCLYRAKEVGRACAWRTEITAPRAEANLDPVKVASSCQPGPHDSQQPVENA
ncbi:MAG: GGDEF domain-containing protein [Planctomycetota bacterium]|nr:GGDEF domain-containing protein [Planctomycetota bacterium]